MTTSLVFPVIVGLGHDTHLTMRDSKKTYCGREWTASWESGANVLITCRPCRKAYAKGAHPAREVAA